MDWKTLYDLAPNLGMLIVCAWIGMKILKFIEQREKDHDVETTKREKQFIGFIKERDDSATKDREETRKVLHYNTKAYGTMTEALRSNTEINAKCEETIANNTDVFKSIRIKIKSESTSGLKRAVE